MKRLLLVFAGWIVGMAHAQTVNWDAAFASCSSEAVAFDRWAVENYATWRNQGTATWRHVRRDEYTSSTIDVALTRQAVQANRSLLSGGPNPRVALDVCVQQAALNQVQSAPTQTTRTVPTPTPVPAVTQRESDEDILQCVRGIDSEDVLVNGCRKVVNLVWCAVPKSDATPNVNCESQQFSAASLTPGGRVSVEDNFLIAWTMCDAPKQVVDVRYVGRQLQGKCQR